VIRPARRENCSTAGDTTTTIAHDIAGNNGPFPDFRHEAIPA
jgi:hypothetical protein